MNRHFDYIDPALSYAREQARVRRWPEVHRALRAARDYAELHRPPIHAEYAVTDLLRRVSATTPHVIESVPHAAPACTGDSEQIAILLRLILATVELQFDARADVMLFDAGDTQALRIRIDGPGRFSASVELGFGIRFSSEQLEGLWTAATRGGRIDSGPGERVLRLRGVRQAPPPDAFDPDVLETLRRTEQEARLCLDEDVAGQAEDAARAGIESLLSALDARDDSSQPGDLSALVRTEIGETDPSDPVRITFQARESIPPLTMRRNRVVRIVHILKTAARSALTMGGALEITVEHSSAERRVDLWFTAEGAAGARVFDEMIPCVRRAVVDAHGGEVEGDVSGSGATVVCLFPDLVARELDLWLPGWHTFSLRSVQMLRLLKGGGNALPEELILGNVLDDELERRLLPRISVAPASHYAHEIVPRKPAPRNSSPDRVEKALTQIRRGNPKKEICSAAYAGELLWLYSKNDIHKSSIAIQNIDKNSLETLIFQLLSEKINYMECLRIIAAQWPVPEGAGT